MSESNKRDEDPFSETPAPDAAEADDAPPFCPRCPRYRGEMDTGKITTSYPALYLSDNRRKRFLPAAPIPLSHAFACHHCGFVQMFVDPKQLQNHLS